MALLRRIAAAGSVVRRPRSSPPHWSAAPRGRWPGWRAASSGWRGRPPRRGPGPSARSVTGADPIPDGHVRSIGAAARGMVEPPPARHTRRVWAHHDRGHGHVQVEVAAPDAEDQPEVRRALRRQLERLEGVEWATVNDVVGRVLVAVDERRVSRRGRRRRRHRDRAGPRRQAGLPAARRPPGRPRAVAGRASSTAAIDTAAVGRRRRRQGAARAGA